MLRRPIYQICSRKLEVGASLFTDLYFLYVRRVRARKIKAAVDLWSLTLALDCKPYLFALKSVRTNAKIAKGPAGDVERRSLGLRVADRARSSPLALCFQLAATSLEPPFSFARCKHYELKMK